MFNLVPSLIQTSLSGLKYSSLSTLMTSINWNLCWLRIQASILLKSATPKCLQFYLSLVTKTLKKSSWYSINMLLRIIWVVWVLNRRVRLSLNGLMLQLMMSLLLFTFQPTMATTTSSSIWLIIARLILRREINLDPQCCILLHKVTKLFLYISSLKKEWILTSLITKWAPLFIGLVTADQK